MTENNELENIPEDIEISEPEIIPNPWDDAPSDVYFYEKMYEDGHLGSFTQSAELAYKSGWDIEHNYIPISDTQQSDINGWTYRKELCPMKTDEDKFNEAKQNKLSELHNAAESALKTAGIKSSLGFKIDANEDAVRNLNGLVDIGHNDVSFCDYDNVIHEHVTAEQVKTMRNEVLLNGQNLYAQKWTYRASVNAAETVDELNAITFKFDMLDFNE